MISGHGPSSAKLMIVTDYPTNEDLLKDKALSGYSESYLKQMLSDTEIRLEQTYRTCYYKDKIRTPSKEQEKHILDYFEKHKNGANYYDILVNELNAIKPNAIIAAGEGALQILTGESNIRKLRGSILRLSPNLKHKVLNPNAKVVPIYHPRNIRKEYISIHYTKVDVEKAIRYAKITEFPENDYIIWVCRSIAHLRNYFNRNKQAKFLVCDIETHFGYMTCIGFSFDGREGVSIPLMEKEMPGLEKALIYQEIAQVLQSGIPIVNQNIGFDEAFLERYGFQLKNIVGDTMLMASILYPELPKNLGFLNSIYNEIPYFKDEGKTYDPFNRKTDPDSLYKYNAKDCVATWRIWEKQIEEAKELRVWNFYIKGVSKFYFLYRNLEKRGIRIDFQQRDFLIEKYSSLANMYGRIVESTVGKQVNVNSPKQVAELLYYEMKLPKQTEKNKEDPKKIKLKTDEETLNFLVLNVNMPEEYKNVLNAIIAERKCKDKLSFLNAVVHPDGRMRTKYKLHGTESGRTSTSNCDEEYYFIDEKGYVKKKYYGIALQTVQKYGDELADGTIIGDDLRSIFIPSEGYCFVDCDLERAEAIVVAALANDWDFYEKCHKIDIHIWTAAMVLKINEDQVTKQQREKQGKRTRHAGHYGMAENTLSIQALISKKEAKEALKNFHAANPNIQSVFQRECQFHVREKRCMVTPFGRRRDFLGRVDTATFRIAYSYIPQSVVSDHTKFSMLRIKEKLPYTEFLGEHHDAFFAEILLGKEEEFFNESKKLVEIPISFKEGSFIRGRDIVIKLEQKVSYTNWQETELWP